MEILPTKVPFWKFWSPPFIYQIPDAPSSHCYVPLMQDHFSARYDNRLMAYPMLAEALTSTTYQSAITSANFVVKTPYFRHLFVRWFLILLFIIYFIDFITSCADGNVAGIIIYLIFLILIPFGMRHGAKQHLDRLYKYRKVLNKAMDSQNRTVFSGSGILVDAGERCLWLDFHTGNYSPPPMQAGYFQNPNLIQPGVQVLPLS